MLYWLFRGFIWVLMRCLLALTGGVRIVGRQHVPRTGGVIIAPNHISHIDAVLAGVSVPRGAYFLGTSELFEAPIIGTLARWIRGYPIRQDSPDRAALRKTEKLLKAGEAVVIFPEGHESVDGTLQPIQGGAAMIALRAGVPVVPAAIRGTNKMMAARTARLRRAPSPAVMLFGEPIGPEELSGGLTGKRAVQHASEVMSARIQALMDQLEREAEPARTIGVAEGIGPGGAESH